MTYQRPTRGRGLSRSLNLNHFIEVHEWSNDCTNCHLPDCVGIKEPECPINIAGIKLRDYRPSIESITLINAEIKRRGPMAPHEIITFASHSLYYKLKNLDMLITIENPHTKRKRRVLVTKVLTHPEIST